MAVRPWSVTVYVKMSLADEAIVRVNKVTETMKEIFKHRRYISMVIWQCQMSLLYRVDDTMFYAVQIGLSESINKCIIAPLDSFLKEQI